ncbi:DUF1349 domain-containing protein [candidate division KSB1 bacterium]|nr:DUF1349 domain-containing protein [candidate division KSB1 bacterium]
MKNQNLLEAFEQKRPDAKLAWYCEPANWSIRHSNLIIKPDAKTDFWQKTHYGFSADNGHCLFAEMKGNFVLSTKLRFQPVNQYDQAGLMVRVSPDCWLKTSVEFEPDSPNMLGAVVTNYGYSDWSTQQYPDDCTDLLLRITRKANDYIVEFKKSEPEQWSQIRLAHLHAAGDPQPVKCGLYACCPIDAGYVVEFEYLKIENE